VYAELRLCIDALAVICLVVGFCLFAGTKRETLWDRDNLVGLLLIGTALSAHGGFDTILRSSPYATFSGYVLGWTRLSGEGASASGWICLYDLGYPPSKEWVDAPYRCVYIPAGRSVPAAVWSVDEVWLLRATYRTRDLQALSIEGKPVPSPKASGLQAWTWQSKDHLFRPALETSVGLALVLGAAMRFVTRRAMPEAKSLHLTIVGDDVHLRD
jgi:hypothetical protein